MCVCVYVCSISVNESERTYTIYYNEGIISSVKNVYLKIIQIVSFKFNQFCQWLFFFFLPARNNSLKTRKYFVKGKFLFMFLRICNHLSPKWRVLIKINEKPGKQRRKTFKHIFLV